MSLLFLISTIIGSEKENISNLVTDELNKLKRVGVAFALLCITAYLVKTYSPTTVELLAQFIRPS
jgi:hypothetical protein